MFCMRCGQDLPQAAEFCPSCGQSTKQPVTPAASGSVAPPPIQQAAVASPEAGQENLRGVGGWLLFFCIGFTVLWPLWVLGQYAVHRIVFRAFGSLGLLRMLFGIVVGVFLWMEKPAAIMLLRIYFLLAVVLALWSIYNWGMFLMRYPGGFTSFGTLSSLLTGFALPLALLAFGIVYFSTSKRVRATYGENLW
jgi:hypothetical protein